MSSLCRGCMFQRKHRSNSEHFKELQWISTDVLTKGVQRAKDLCNKNLLEVFFWANFSSPQMSFFFFFYDLATVSSDTAQ